MHKSLNKKKVSKAIEPRSALFGGGRQKTTNAEKSNSTVSVLQAFFRNGMNKISAFPKNVRNSLHQKC